MGGTEKSRLLCGCVWWLCQLSCVPQLFRQIINTMLCPAFFRKFVCQPLCCVPCLRRWIPCCLLTNTAMTSAVTNFWCHKLITIVNKWKDSDMKNFICNWYGERPHILDTENIKIYLRFFLFVFSYLLNICKKWRFYFPRQCSNNAQGEVNIVVSFL